MSVPLFGTTVPSGSVSDWQGWNGLVAPSQCMKIFFNPGSDPTQAGAAPTTSGTVTNCITLGMSGLLLYKPAYASNTNGSGQPTNAQMSTDLTNIQASVQAFVNQGLNLAGVAIWNEPQQAGGVQSTSRPMPQQYQALYAYMYPTFNGNGWPVWSVHTTGGWGPPNYLQVAYFPGPSSVTSYNPSRLYVDKLAIDWYGGGYSSSQWLYTKGAGGGLSSTNPSWCDLCDLNGIAFGGLPEAGNSAGTTDRSQSVITKYLSAETIGGFPGDPEFSIQATMDYRAQAGLPTTWSVCWWDQLGNSTNFTGISANNANPCTFTLTGSNATNNTQMTLSNISGIRGFVAGQVYYVVNATANTFQLAATSGGTALGSTLSGTCNATLYSFNGIFNPGDFRIPLLRQFATAGPQAAIMPRQVPALSRASGW